MGSADKVYASYTHTHDTQTHYRHQTDNHRQKDILTDIDIHTTHKHTTHTRQTTIDRKTD